MSDCKKVTSSDKWSASLLAAVVFGAMSTGIAHKLLDKLAGPFGFEVLGSGGGLTIAGLFVLSFVFMIITRVLMM